MNKWVYVNENSLVVYTTSFADDATEPPTPQNGSVFVKVPYESDDVLLLKSWFNFSEKTLQPLPAKPNNDSFYRWDWKNVLWVFDNEAAIKATNIRRQALLSSSDWTQLPDAQLTNKTEWAAYRQLLRDLPQQDGYPQQIIWPTAPATLSQS